MCSEVKKIWPLKKKLKKHIQDIHDVCYTKPIEIFEALFFDAAFLTSLSFMLFVRAQLHFLATHRTFLTIYICNMKWPVNFKSKPRTMGLSLQIVR